MRYCFDKGELDNTESLSLTAGLSLLNKELVPTVGISVVPAALKIDELWRKKEEGFPHHYSELTLGYGANQLLLGANYSYIPSRIGLYISSLIGLDMDWGVNLGPAYRLVDPNDIDIDIIAFQGFGLFSGCFAGETGIRFGFADEMKYSLWSLSASMGYSKQGIYGMLGMSWPIAAYAGTVAAMVGYAAALVMGGGDASEAANILPEWPTTGNGGYKAPSISQAESPQTEMSNSNDCGNFQSRYDQMAQNVQRLIQGFENTGSGHIDRQRNPYKVYVKQCGDDVINCVSASSLMSYRQTLRRCLQDMRDLRRKAERAGCTIRQSPWESAQIEIF